MLRIQRSENGEVVFALSGRMDAENIAELKALLGAEAKDRRMVLDLKDVTLVDRDAIAFLEHCDDCDKGTVDCSSSRACEARR